MSKDKKETLSPMCVSCGKRAKTSPYDTGHALWASLPKGWFVGLRGKSLTFACSKGCAREMDDLNARAARVSAPLMALLAST
jgi:hypothetical protein